MEPYIIKQTGDQLQQILNKAIVSAEANTTEDGKPVISFTASDGSSFDVSLPDFANRINYLLQNTYYLQEGIGCAAFDYAMSLGDVTIQSEEVTRQEGDSIILDTSANRFVLERNGKFYNKFLSNGASLQGWDVYANRRHTFLNKQDTSYWCYKSNGSLEKGSSTFAIRNWLDTLQSESDLAEANIIQHGTQLTELGNKIFELGEFDTFAALFARAAKFDIVSNNAIALLHGTYKQAEGIYHGVLILQQVEKNNAGGGTAMQYIYIERRQYTRYINFSATAVTEVQAVQNHGARNLSLSGRVLQMKNMWGYNIGDSATLPDNGNLYEGTAGASSVPVTLAKTFGGTATATLGAATSARAGVMTAADKSKLDAIDQEIIERDIVSVSGVANTALNKANENSTRIDALENPPAPDYAEMIIEAETAKHYRLFYDVRCIGWLDIDGEEAELPIITEDRTASYYSALSPGRHVVRFKPKEGTMSDGTPYKERQGLLGWCGANGVTEITLPEGWTVLNIKMFEGAESLRRVNLPSTITEVRYGAFGNCTALEEIVLPPSVEAINHVMAHDCPALKRIVLGGRDISAYGTLAQSCAALECVEFRAGGTVAFTSSNNTFVNLPQLARFIVKGNLPTFECSQPFTSTGYVGSAVSADNRWLFTYYGETPSGTKWQTSLMSQCGFTVKKALSYTLL